MLLKTKSFGDIEIGEEKFITFKEGIPGFEELKQFIIIEEEEESPFCYLQSIEDEAICFILTNPYLFKPDYEPAIAKHYFQQLGGGDLKNFSVFAMVSVKGEIETATLNLMAPLVIQQETRFGMQVILDGQDYTTKHAVLDLLAERGEQSC
ncbi:flagellar assembly protein FliW [Sporanaerobium hydrogeniformans]|uniref:Flagellar assembly protein FliW n=1 Tax=Sporanaerobium hydrogeniformans TaxID=3072179 RepID=A0AC61DB72_9FIRM|nr:flagellar assembly protein FliW [Sporanaerobium hydrogeniformans]PHV69832.1 flagellar assembly protein FliW [Sporanaerobium hydrogeniformans]